MTFDDTNVRKAWDQNAQLWADRVRAGVDLYREAFNTPSFLAILPDLAGREKLLILAVAKGQIRDSWRFAAHE
ncbi:MAG: hypothetical protein QOI13_444 [Paraburkholderia sp.]|nr:hypothetical protein [Paraburkholderia sp.]